MSASLRLETIADEAAFLGLRDEWDELLESSAADGFFLTWEWLHSWWTHLSGGRRLAMLALRRGPQLVALAPFAARRDLVGGTRLELLGTGRAGSDYLDVIVRRGDEREAVACLAAHLARQGALVELRQLRGESSARQLALALRDAGWAIRPAAARVCPFADLRGHSFASYLSSLGAEHRYAFQRKLRGLRAQRPRFERVSSEARRRELLPVLFELHRLRWSGRGGSDGLAGPGVLEFHQELSRLALLRGWLRLFVLWLDGAPAAALYGFRRRHVFYFYQSGFDPRFGRLGVGVVAMGLAIESATLEGAAEFDMLHGEEPYKFHWAKRSRGLEQMTAFPAGARGRLSWGHATALAAARALVRGLPGERGHAAAAR